MLISFGLFLFVSFCFFESDSEIEKKNIKLGDNGSVRISEELEERKMIKKIYKKIN